MKPLGQGMLIANACISFFNTGLQWYTQVSTYPLFHALPDDAFVAYHKAYETRLPLSIYAPYSLLMSSNLLLLMRSHPKGQRTWVVAMLLLNAMIMVESLVVAVPIHTRLDQTGKDAAAIGKLVQLNAVRLATSTASSAIALYLIARNNPDWSSASSSIAPR